MKNTTSAFIMGVVFAWGLGISQMTKPPKIIGFLNVLGDWDPTLLVVLLAAVGVYYLGYHYIIPEETRVDIEAHLEGKEQLGPLVIFGAAIFGLGWGMIGLCPGPAITDLLSFRQDIFMFVIGMLMGVYSAKSYAQ